MLKFPISIFIRYLKILTLGMFYKGIYLDEHIDFFIKRFPCKGAHGLNKFLPIKKTCVVNIDLVEYLLCKFIALDEYVIDSVSECVIAYTLFDILIWWINKKHYMRLP